MHIFFQLSDESNDKDDDDDDDNNVDSFTNTKIIISTAKRKNRSISPGDLIIWNNLHTSKRLIMQNEIEIIQ